MKHDSIARLVNELYEAKNSNRAEWADWLYTNHVLVCAKWAKQLAEKYKGDIDVAVSLALLHDVADAVMPRLNPEHEAKSLEIARDFLIQAGYDAKQTESMVNDSLKNHSCHDGIVPTTLEGKILSTADSYAHLTTDFYLFAAYGFAATRSYDDYKAWLRKKVEHDIHEKVLFEEEKEYLIPYYNKIMGMASQ
ncbi:HD domain-containing protein [Candidatus Saccharibacteria bacterium]|jgi:HD superfamily phosphodiesterase|nr:HD domain-containing protein [Candidatus Saccharibacteria bacterium]